MNDELLSFYGFTHDPFGPVTDVADLSAAESQGQLADQILTDIAAEPGIVSVRGDEGIGKTSISRLVALALRRHGVMAVELAAGLHNALQMQGLIGRAVGIGESERLTPDQLARELPARLGQSGLALVVDDAQRLPESTYRYLMLLRAGLGLTKVGFGLVLVGTPGRWPSMEGLDLAGLQPESVARHVIFPLREDEAAELLNHKLRQAGRSIRDVLSASAATALVKEAEGVPARLEALAASAFNAAYARRRRRVTLRTVWPSLSRGRDYTTPLLLRSLRGPAIATGCLLLAGMAAGGYVWRDEIGLDAGRQGLATAFEHIAALVGAQPEAASPTVMAPDDLAEPFAQSARSRPPRGLPPGLAQTLPRAAGGASVGVAPVQPTVSEPPAAGAQRRAREPPHGSPGLILVAGADDTLPALYARVYRGVIPPPYAAVAAANHSPVRPGDLLVFPEPPNGWSKR